MALEKPSITFLPMEDIAGDLKENRNFMTNTLVTEAIETAIDPLAVSVAGDNTTVENSLKLGGLVADDYMTSEDGTKIIGVADNMSTLFSGEVKNLRDELYQLKSQLSKNGYIEETIPYEGFQDSFKNNNIKYERLICGIFESSIALTDTLFISDESKIRDFEVGKSFIIKKTDTTEEQIVTVATSDGVNKITFYPSSSLLFDKDTIELHKTSGMYLRDSFSFSKVVSGVDIGSKERYHMQSDDTMTTPRQISATGTGYAIYFKVPDNCVTNFKAALTSFAITAKAIGNPGNLLCHVVKADSIYDTGVFAPKFTSIQDAKDKGLVIATSQPIKAEDAFNESQLAFNFFDLSTNEYPVISNTQYLFVIECVNADATNLWNIRFSYYMNGASLIEDLEKNNASFDFHTVIDTGSNPLERSISVIDDIDKYDMLFMLTTKEIIDQTEYGNKEGLYTVKIILPKPIDISRARLTTRIEREGCWYVESYDASYTKFTLAKEDVYAASTTDLRFDDGDTIIIGNQVGTVKKSTSNTVELYAPIFIDSRIEKLYTKNNTSTKIPVYRMNYDVSIKPYLVDWTNFDTVKKEFVSTAVTNEIVNLDLVAVLPTGSNKAGSRISDRLLFEGNFGNDDNGIAKLANEFEFQMRWKSKFEFAEINKPENIQNGFNELIGRINDLILSFDKNY